MKRFHNFIEKHPIKFLVFFLFVLFIFSFWFSYLFIFVKTPIGVISNDFSADWLQWIGAFMSGAIGGIFTFVGIKITLDNQRKEIQFENKRKALPLIEIKNGQKDYKPELFTENQKLIITSGLPSLFSFIVLHEKNEKRVHFC